MLRTTFRRAALLVPLLALPACAHTRKIVYLEPGRPVDLEKFDPHTQSLIMPLAAGEVFPLDVAIDGDFVATEPGAAVELRVKRSCFVRVDDRGLRVSADRHDFDARPKGKGSFQLGLDVTEKGKRATLHVVTPSRIP